MIFCISINIRYLYKSICLNIYFIATYLKLFTIIINYFNVIYCFFHCKCLFNFLYIINLENNYFTICLINQFIVCSITRLRFKFIHSPD